ncbi:MAG: ComEC/Rec2 family competence protein [Actinomycetota bacterium]
MNVAGLAAVAVAAGTASGSGRSGLTLPLTAACVLALACTALTGLTARRGRFALAAALVALAAGAGASAAWRSTAVEASLLPRLAEQRASVRVCGMAQLLRPRSIEIRAERVKHLAPDDGQDWTTKEPLRISGENVGEFRPGERICASGRLADAREGRDEAPLLVAERMRADGSGSTIRLAAGEVRTRFSEAAQHALPKAQAGLLLGMTDGDVRLLDEAIMEDFRTTGIAHLVAVSGSNVAVVLVVVMLITRALIPRSRLVRALAALPPLVFFAFLTGLEPSVLRAVVTAGVALAVTAGGRLPDAIRLACIAFVLLVLATPDLLFHPGFQLSFAATLGLILWARPLTERLDRLLPTGRGWTVVAIAVGTTLSAQVAAAPLLAWHFGRVPALGGAANLIAAPLAPIVMIGGLVTLGLSSLVAALDWLPATMRLPLDVVLASGRWFARAPAASLGVSVLTALAATAMLAVVVAGSARARAGAGACVILFAAASAGRLIGGQTCPGASVTALDVGQGTAVLLRDEGHAVLVDGGPEAGGVTYDLEEVGVRRLDAVFVSHPHADHTEGVVRVLERLDVGRVMGPVTLPWRKGGDVVRSARKAGVPVIEVAAGEILTFGRIRIEVVFPPPGPAPPYAEELVHSYSLVLRAELGRATVLLPGDVGAEEEEELLDDDVGAAIFVAAHHGSKDLDPAFVEAVDPLLTLVTVGANNRYGHPTPEAIEAYSRHGNVFRTDQDGSVSVCLAGENAEVTTAR